MIRSRLAYAASSLLIIGTFAASLYEKAYGFGPGPCKGICNAGYTRTVVSGNCSKDNNGICQGTCTATYEVDQGGCVAFNEEYTGVDCTNVSMPPIHSRLYDAACTAPGTCACQYESIGNGGLYSLATCTVAACPG